MLFRSIEYNLFPIKSTKVSFVYDQAIKFIGLTRRRGFTCDSSIQLKTKHITVFDKCKYEIGSISSSKLRSFLLSSNKFPMNFISQAGTQKYCEICYLTWHHPTSDEKIMLLVPTMLNMYLLS